MPRSPTRTSTGSPGTSRIRMNVRRMMPRKVGITNPRRVRTKRSMNQYRPKEEGRGKHPFPAPEDNLAELLLDVDAFEDVGAQRVHLVADHRLLHWHVDQRMRDRN